MDDTSEIEVIQCFFPPMPQFPGGQEAMMTYIKENMVYPVDAIKGKIEGKVVLQFVIGKDGKIGNVKSVKEGVDNRLVKEAI